MHSPLAPVPGNILMGYRKIKLFNEYQSKNLNFTVDI